MRNEGFPQLLRSPQHCITFQQRTIFHLGVFAFAPRTVRWWLWKYKIILNLEPQKANYTLHRKKSKYDKLLFSSFAHSYLNLYFNAASQGQEGCIFPLELLYLSCIVTLTITAFPPPRWHQAIELKWSLFCSPRACNLKTHQDQQCLYWWKTGSDMRKFNGGCTIFKTGGSLQISGERVWRKT